MTKITTTQTPLSKLILDLERIKRSDTKPERFYVKTMRAEWENLASSMFRGAQ